MAKRKRRGKPPRNNPSIQGSPVPWLDHDGLHMLLPGDSPSGVLLDQLTEQYQQNIRNSPLWEEVVRRFGPQEAERLLKAFRVEAR